MLEDILRAKEADTYEPKAYTGLMHRDLESGEKERFTIKDKRVKSVDYIEGMYVTEDDERILFHYVPKTSGLEEGMISVSGDTNGYKRLDLKFHFEDAELQVIEVGK